MAFFTIAARRASSRSFWLDLAALPMIADWLPPFWLRRRASRATSVTTSSAFSLPPSGCTAIERLSWASLSRVVKMIAESS